MIAKKLLQANGITDAGRVFVRQQEPETLEGKLVFPTRIHSLSNEGVAYGPGLPILMNARFGAREATVRAAKNVGLDESAAFYLHEGSALGYAYVPR